MKPSDILKQAEDEFQSAAHQCRTAMEPHLVKMETDEGKVGMVMISGIAMLVHTGVESQAALASTIKFAAEMTGIPTDALDAYARFTIAMMNAKGAKNEYK